MPGSPAPHTVLIHGLGRSRYDMLLLGHRLSRLMPDTTVHIFDYHSRKLCLGDCVEQLNNFVARNVNGEPVSFIGHSLGGIVVRALDHRRETSAPLRRLVTLGSPHNGAQIAQHLAKYRAFNALFGPILDELGSLQLPASTSQLEIGCIIGGLGHRWGFLPVFGEDNDGLVLAREASLAGSADSISMPIFHGLFPFSARATRQAAHFLQHGFFSHLP